jgi:hypothetical protein
MLRQSKRYTTCCLRIDNLVVSVNRRTNDFVLPARAQSSRMSQLRTKQKKTIRIKLIEPYMRSLV